MAGTATITTKTTVIPVTVTEVKNGTVMQNLGIEHRRSHRRRHEDVHAGRHRQARRQDLEEGKPAQISDFRDNDKLTATIITTKPPTGHDREGGARRPLAKSGGGGGGTAAAAAPARRRLRAPARSTAAAPPRGERGGGARACAEKLPKTASNVPLLGLVGLASLVAGLGLTVRRRATR